MNNKAKKFKKTNKINQKNCLIFVDKTHQISKIK